MLRIRFICTCYHFFFTFNCFLDEGNTSRSFVVVHIVFLWIFLAFFLLPILIRFIFIYPNIKLFFNVSGAIGFYLTVPGIIASNYGMEGKKIDRTNLILHILLNRFASLSFFGVWIYFLLISKTFSQPGFYGKTPWISTYISIFCVLSSCGCGLVAFLAGKILV
jgi:hypothetical protein